jgi:hypothetical protein
MFGQIELPAVGVKQSGTVSAHGCEDMTVILDNVQDALWTAVFLAGSVHGSWLDGEIAERFWGGVGCQAESRALQRDHVEAVVYPTARALGTWFANACRIYGSKLLRRASPYCGSIAFGSGGPQQLHGHPPEPFAGKVEAFEQRNGRDVGEVALPGLGCRGAQGAATEEVNQQSLQKCGRSREFTFSSQCAQLAAL